LLISDGSPEYARVRLERYGLDWPHMFMPWGRRSPTARLWGIREWPTTFVLDKEGVIRFRSMGGDLRGEKLEAAVLSLLDPESNTGNVSASKD